MARPLRICYPGAWYHVFDQCLAKKHLFKDDALRKEFLRILGTVAQTQAIEIHAYCLLETSFHLLIRTPNANLSSAMRQLLSSFTQHYNKQENCDGPLFNRRYKSILLENNETLLKLSRYIHRLPRTKKLVRSLANYPWSSFQAYVGLHLAPDWLNTKTVSGFFAERNGMAIYRIYTETGNDEDLDAFYRHKRLPPALGGTSFIQSLKIYFPEDLSELPQARLLMPRPSIAEIIHRVAHSYCLPEENLLQSRRGRGHLNLPRALALCLCRRLGGHSLKDIASAFGVTHYSTVSVAMNRLDHRLLKDVHLQNTYDSIQAQLRVS